MEFTILGLNKYETEAYKALIKLGKSSAAEISRESGVPYGRIYDILASLESKGLVIVVPELSKKYMPSDPKNLINLITKRNEELASLKKEMENLQQVYHIHQEEVVELVKGKKNFYKIIKKLPNPKKSKYNIRYLTEAKPQWLMRSKAQLKKKIDVKSLVDEKKGSKTEMKRWLKVLPELRHFENEGVAVSIIDEKALMIGLIHSNISLLIKDKAFVKMMKQLFLNAYKQSRKITV